LTKNLIGENIFILVFKDSIEIFESLINFIEDLIAKKISFEVNLDVS
jgi:hypothetical protein